MVKNLKRRVESSVVNITVFFLQWGFKGKSREVCLKRGAVIGNLIYKIGIRKKVVLKNLTIAFGDIMSEEEIQALVKKHYAFVGSNFGELMYSQTISREELLECIVPEDRGKLSEIQNIMQEKAVILMSGHFGSWELYNLFLPLIFPRVCAYSGKQRNSHIENQINVIRSRFGTELIPKSSRSTFTIMKRLKKKYLMAIVGDVGLDKNKIFIDFFGLKCGVGLGSAYFHLRTDSKVYFTVLPRDENNRYRLSFEEIQFEKDADENISIKNFTTAFMNKLEDVIKKYPEQYFWIHRIWKHAPPEEPDRKIY